jgi:hypothetical protein
MRNGLAIPDTPQTLKEKINNDDVDPRGSDVSRLVALVLVFDPARGNADPVVRGGTINFATAGWQATPDFDFTSTSSVSRDWVFGLESMPVTLSCES